jgi:hypothetical protein
MPARPAEVDLKKNEIKKAELSSAFFIEATPAFNAFLIWFSANNKMEIGLVCIKTEFIAKKITFECNFFVSRP